MDARQLMMGDWVQSKAHNGEYLYTRIRVLDSRGTKKHIISDNRWIEDDAFEPIPLTPEILKKNGFRYECNYGSFMRSILGDYSKDREPVVCIGYNPFREICNWDICNGNGRAAFGKGGIAVHQLQHALRLCGLTELADNFQI